MFFTADGILNVNRLALAMNGVFATAIHQHRSRKRPIRSPGFPLCSGGKLMADNVLIGATCVLLDGTVLRQGCVVGAGSIVTGELEAYGIYAGQPLQLKGHRT